MPSRVIKASSKLLEVSIQRLITRFFVASSVVVGVIKEAPGKKLAPTLEIYDRFATVLA